MYICSVPAKNYDELECKKQYVDVEYIYTLKLFDVFIVIYFTALRTKVNILIGAALHSLQCPTGTGGGPATAASRGRTAAEEKEGGFRQGLWPLRHSSL